MNLEPIAPTGWLRLASRADVTRDPSCQAFYIHDLVHASAFYPFAATFIPEFGGGVFIR